MCVGRKPGRGVLLILPGGGSRPWGLPATPRCALLGSSRARPISIHPTDPASAANGSPSAKAEVARAEEAGKAAAKEANAAKSTAASLMKKIFAELEWLGVQVLLGGKGCG